MLTEEDFSRSFEEGRCPFCGSENIDIAINCPFYGGYIYDCDGYFDGSCAYCDPEYREPDPDVYLCEDCNKGYNFKTKNIITDLFLYCPNPGYTFRHNIEKSKQLCSQFPEQSIIMVVSAMESYFHDKFISIVNSNSKYKLGELFAKDHNFQNLEVVNKLYKKAFDLNIETILGQINPDLFRKIVKIVSIRNLIIHNCGIIDKQALSVLGLNSDGDRKEYLGKSINVTEDKARQSISNVETAILAIEKEIDTKFKTGA